MNLKQLQESFNASLSGQYEPEEIMNFFYLLSEHYLGFKRIDISLNGEAELNATQQNKFSSALDRLSKNEPIQYIIGSTEFYGLPLKVNEHTLIPRPETEELVEWILTDHHENNSVLKVIDLGTGSGCIAISLAANKPQWKVTALDLSEEALKVAKANAELNHCEVSFLQSDIRSGLSDDSYFDIIVSNPPYVRESERKEIRSNVKDYEPEMALFVSDADPLVYYRTIAMLAKTHLNERGSLYLEINEYLGRETQELLLNMGFNNLELRNDFRGKPRMIKCQFNESTQ